MKIRLTVWTACLLALVAGSTLAADNPAKQPVKLSFTEDEFRSGTAHKTNQIAITAGGRLVVELGSNPTTGFSWGENAINSDPAVVKQVQHQHRRINPKEHRPGAGGSQTWTFEAVKAGTATLNFSYGRPWAGGEKGVWTLKLVVKVE